MDIDYKHTVTVDRNSWWMRFYCWLWDADADNADFCKLFWGYLFAIPFLIILPFLYLIKGIGIVLKFIFKPVGKVFLKVEDHYIDKSIAKDKAIEEGTYVPSKRQRFLSKIANGFSSFGFWLKTSPVIEYFFMGLVVLLMLAMVGGLVYLAIAETAGFLIGLLVVVAVAAGLAVLFGILMLVVHFCESDTGIGFGQAIKTGLISAKSNTCPKIEIK